MVWEQSQQTTYRYRPGFMRSIGNTANQQNDHQSDNASKYFGHCFHSSSVMLQTGITRVVERRGCNREKPDSYSGHSGLLCDAGFKRARFQPELLACLCLVALTLKAVGTTPDRP